MAERDSPGVRAVQAIQEAKLLCPRKRSPVIRTPKPQTANAHADGPQQNADAHVDGQTSLVEFFDALRQPHRDTQALPQPAQAVPSLPRRPGETHAQPTPIAASGPPLTDPRRDELTQAWRAQETRYDTALRARVRPAGMVLHQAKFLLAFAAEGVVVTAADMAGVRPRQVIHRLAIVEIRPAQRARLFQEWPASLPQRHQRARPGIDGDGAAFALGPIPPPAGRLYFDIVDRTLKSGVPDCLDTRLDSTRRASPRRALHVDGAGQELRPRPRGVPGRDPHGRHLAGRRAA